VKRREFITLLGGAAAAWPLTARAQQRMRPVGVLMMFSETDPEGQAWVKAFERGLSDRGWIDGRNVRIDYRWAEGDLGQIQPLAKQLIDLQPDVILASTTPVLAALKRETATLPIVFVSVSNPVGAGFVSSLANPGGNVTGLANFESEMATKWLQALKEIAPRVRQVSGTIAFRYGRARNLLARSCCGCLKIRGRPYCCAI
jgi:putative tryptophan/tyrosine transport system substrate-binding protein